jgi:tetratricopeptide (TPR) repeat protein
VHLTCADILELTGDYAAAETHVQDALRLASTDVERQSRCYHALGVLTHHRGEHAAAERWLEQAQRGWEVVNNLAGLAQTHIERGYLAWHMGTYGPAYEHLEAGLTLARSLNQQTMILNALNGLGAVWMDGAGDFDQAERYLTESLDYGRALGEQRPLIMSLHGLGGIAKYHGNTTLAQERYEESLAIARAIGDKDRMASELHHLAFIQASVHNYAAAHQRFEEALVLTRSIGSLQGTAMMLNSIGCVLLEQGRYDEAESRFAESLDLSRAINADSFIVMAIGNLGYLALMHDAPAQAQVYLDEGIARSRTNGQALNLITLLGAYGLYAWRYGTPAEAEAHWREGLAVLGEKTPPFLCSEILVGHAAVQCYHTRYHAALLLVAAAGQLRTRFQLTWGPLEQQLSDTTLATLQAHIDAETFAQLWREGQELSPEAAIALALQPNPA